MMQLRDISFCASLRDKLTAARAVCGSVSRLNCYDTHMRARAAKQDRERRILVSYILILLSCCLPLAFCDPISAATAIAATMTSPAPSSTLTSAATTFTWSAGSGGVTGYYLWVGTSPGTANLGGYTAPPGLSVTVNVPTTGATIYVRVWTQINGTTMLYNDYTYTEATLSAATMTSPSPSSTLTSASTTFTWAAGTGNVTAYYVWIGTSPGTSNIGGYTPPHGTSLTVTLPTTGATIYVRLWTQINGSTYLYNDYTYTEATFSAATMTSPGSDSVLSLSAAIESIRVSMRLMKKLATLAILPTSPPLAAKRSTPSM